MNPGRSAIAALRGVAGRFKPVDDNALTFYRLLGGVNAFTAGRRIVSLRRESRLMVGVILTFVLGYSIVGYALFYMGFAWLAKLPGIGVLLLDRMLYLFFAFLFLMLVFSNMIIGYSTMYRSLETEWMLTLPVPASAVFRWKLLETMVLASWAFWFLSAPFMLAYGTVRHAGFWFYVKILVLLLPFTLLPAALGGLVVLVVTRYLHRRLFKWVLLGVGAVVAAAAVFFVRPIGAESIQQAQVMAALDQMLHNSRLTVHPLMPSYWVGSSIIAWSEGMNWRGTFFFLVLLSNALMAGLACVLISRRMFYDGWSRTHSQGRWKVGVALLDKAIHMPRMGLLERAAHLWPRLHPATRALVVKDIRVFWRDTAQWSQFVIFFGLLALYVLNLRHVTYDKANVMWGGFVSFLNLGASCMTLATLTTRFVFPQFSLEGKRLWIVGMVPYGLKRVLLEKFWLSSAWSIAITLTLTMCSSLILRLPSGLTILFSATVVLMCFALCGIAVGIGAIFPNFGSGSTANRLDDNPSKIVSGFGGTFCFVMSLLYILLVMGAEALIIYVLHIRTAMDPQFQHVVVTGSWIFICIASLAASFVPMRIALQRVEHLEI